MNQQANFRFASARHLHGGGSIRAARRLHGGGSIRAGYRLDGLVAKDARRIYRALRRSGEFADIARSMVLCVLRGGRYLDEVGS